MKPKRFDWRKCSQAELRDSHEVLRAAALQRCGGGRSWRQWKARQFEKIVELASEGKRMCLMHADLTGDINVVYEISMPIPLTPRNGQLVIGDMVRFHLNFQDCWRVQAPPPWGPLGTMFPLNIFHPNFKPALRGACCLGRLQPAVSLKELILLGYYMLTLQAINMDETDPEGVFNPRASDFYRDNPQYRPLTRAGLLDDWPEKPNGDT